MNEGRKEGRKERKITATKRGKIEEHAELMKERNINGMKGKKIIK
jgi:hypothetical protein